MTESRGKNSRGFRYFKRFLPLGGRIQPFRSEPIRPFETEIFMDFDELELQYPNQMNDFDKPRGDSHWLPAVPGFPHSMA